MKFRIGMVRSVTHFGVLCGVFLLAVGFVPAANAATHTVAASVKSVDCRSFGGGIRAGDSVILSGRSRGPVTFNDCEGTAVNPITIRNDTSLTGPLIIEQGGEGFQTRCNNCKYVVIDGTGKWAGAPAGVCGASIIDGQWQLGTSQCGIVLRCTGGSPHSSLRISGSSQFMTIKGLEIDGNRPVCKRGSGLSVNDHQYVPKPGEWREGFVITNNYIHHAATTGLYFGPNQAHNAADDLLVRNNEISNNYVNGTGCDGIKYKSAVSGESKIHHNFVMNTGEGNGKGEDGCGANGISLFEAGYTEVFSNYVEAPNPNSDGRGNCIVQSTLNISSKLVATLPVEIYNNVVRNCGGKGIASSRSKTSNPRLLPTIYNNTIVAPVGKGGISINANVDSCTVRDNILAGVNLDAGKCSTSRNLVTAIPSLKFLDAAGDDYRLTESSPAIDSGDQCPREDHFGNERPQGGACDQGAMEFITGQTTALKPNPPGSLAVE